MTWQDVLTPLWEVVARKEMTEADAQRIFDALADGDLDGLKALWPFWERPNQKEPPGDWTVWLMMAGRGFGKTRSGAGWLVERVLESGPGTYVALVGATANDARAVMVEGESGVLAASSEAERPIWEPTLGRLLWPSGAQGWVYSAESAERLRGPQFHFAWCDEIAAWPDPDAWTNLRMALRAGVRPRVRPVHWQGAMSSGDGRRFRCRGGRWPCGRGTGLPSMARTGASPNCGSNA
jgi:phage terminase large subunit-like protein